MEYNNINFLNKAIILNNCLIISDIHIGYEESLNNQGYLIPRLQFKEIIKELDKLTKNKKFNKIIINGDLKHEFGKISETEWRHTLRFIDYLSKKCNELILVKGNHDTILGPLADKRNITVVDQYTINDTLITHGDKIVKIPKGIKTIIIGHEHPAITLTQGSRTEKYKCFLIGKWKKYDLIVTPSFNPLIEGSDILYDELLSPYLTNIDNFQVYVIGDKIFNFGKFKDLKKKV